MLCYHKPKSHTQNNSDFFGDKVVQIKVSMVPISSINIKKNFRTKANKKDARSQFLLHSAITHETYQLSRCTACKCTLILVWMGSDD